MHIPGERSYRLLQEKEAISKKKLHFTLNFPKMTFLLTTPVLLHY